MGLAVTYGAAGTEDALASGTAPRVLHVLAVQATYDLQSVYFFCLSDLRSAYQAVFGLYPLLFYKVGCVFLWLFILVSPVRNTTSYV